MKPSLREKKRYIVLITNLDKNDAEKEVMRCVSDFIGILGSARAGVQFLGECWDKKKKMGVIRCNNRYANEVKASLILSKKKFSVPLTTGVIKKAKTFIKRYNPDKIQK